jgi:hypothetical protein
VTTTDDAGLATSTNICSTVPSGSYSQTATLQSNQQQALFSFSLRGLVLLFQGADSTGVATFEVTSPAGIAVGLAATVEYRTGPAANFVTGLELSRTTTPATLTVTFGELNIPVGNYSFDVIVSTTTPGLGAGMATISFFNQSGYIQPNVSGTGLKRTAGTQRQ